MELSLSDYLKLPEKYIPDGLYCYGENGKCPFWDLKEGEYPVQEDGYCHYLGKSDWDLNEDRKDSVMIVQSDNKEIEGKSVAEVFGDDEIDPVSGKVIHFGFSLIWDQCKECDVNRDDPDDIELVSHVGPAVDLGFGFKNKK